MSSNEYDTEFKSFNVKLLYKLLLTSLRLRYSRFPIFLANSGYFSENLIASIKLGKHNDTTGKLKLKKKYTLIIKL